MSNYILSAGAHFSPHTDGNNVLVGACVALLALLASPPSCRPLRPDSDPHNIFYWRFYEEVDEGLAISVFLYLQDFNHRSLYTVIVYLNLCPDGAQACTAHLIRVIRVMHGA